MCNGIGAIVKSLIHVSSHKLIPIHSRKLALVLV